MKFRDKLKDDLIKGNILSNLFLAMGVSIQNKVLISSVSSRYITINFIIASIGTILIGRAWDKYSDKLYKMYIPLIVAQNILFISLTVLVVNNIVPYNIYYIINIIIFVVFSKNIFFGGNKLKSVLYKGSNRNQFDNDIEVTKYVSSLLGYVICLIVIIPTKLAFIFMALGLLMDGIFNIRAYMKLSKDKTEIISVDVAGNKEEIIKVYSNGNYYGGVNAMNNEYSDSIKKGINEPSK